MRLASPPIKGGPRVLGADVAKTSVVLFDSQDRRCVSIANEPRALKAALADLAEAELVVCEATGGYERALLEAAAAIGLAAHRADPLRVKRYIASLGGMAKTDAIDAAWLARYGQERGPSLARWRPQDADAEALAKLARHRLQLVRRRAQARNQQSAPDSQAIAPFLAAELAFLDQQVATLDQAIAGRMASSTSLSERHKALRAIAGFGPVVAPSLLALVPELGRLSRRQVASLAGLAPHPKDSGQSRQRRRTGPGRDGLRPLLFMAAMAAIRANGPLKAFAQRLALAAKPKRLILTAVARKLVVLANARLRDLTSPQLT